MFSSGNAIVAQRIQPEPTDTFDRPYHFGKPLNYLSEREQARLLILRGRIREPRDETR